MHNRLKQFLAAENISQSQFADEIGVARASVSHILAGRNRPGFDFIESMLIHYPALNPEWLITGKGKMYKEAPAAQILQNIAEPAAQAEPLQETPSRQAALPFEKEEVFSKVIESTTTAKAKQVIEKQKNIVKVVIFYDDNSFLEVK